MTAPYVNKKLNLVIPVGDPEAPFAWVHSTPIGRDVFESNYLIIGRALGAIYRNGLAANFGPRLAALALRDAGTDPSDAEPLMMEIRRLSSVLIRNSGGWDSFQLQEAIDRKLLDEDAIAEVEGQIVFFTLVYCLQGRKDAETVLAIACGFWASQLVSLNSTEFGRSLRTSTETENSGEKEAASSIPS